MACQFRTCSLGRLRAHARIFSSVETARFADRSAQFRYKMDSRAVVKHSKSGRVAEDPLWNISVG